MDEKANNELRALLSLIDATIEGTKAQTRMLNRIVTEIGDIRGDQRRTRIDIGDIKVALVVHGNRFDALDNRLDAMDKRFDAVVDRFDTI